MMEEPEDGSASTSGKKEKKTSTMSVKSEVLSSRMIKVSATMF
jgi:hypothetical protein